MRRGTSRETALSKTGVALLAGWFGLFAGCCGGIGIGLLSTEAGRSALDAFVSIEEDADVGAPQKLVRDGFELEYPGNWTIELDDEEGDDLDHQFTIDSPGDCFIQFQIIDIEVDTREHLEDYESYFVPKFIADPKKSTFESWGSLAGDGIALEGRILHINPGRIRIFAWSGTEGALTVTEFCYDEDEDAVEPGFELVRSTFRFR